MKLLLRKEWKLSASLLTKLFPAFALLTLVPGYPILLGAFFSCFGIFQTFQKSREDNDILYTALLPVAKRDVVTARFLFVMLIQGISFALTVLFTVLRMEFLNNRPPYSVNPLMAANLAFLGFALLIYAAFNLFFVRGYFRTAYGFSRPFIRFIISAAVLVTFGEALHHFPGMAWLNASAGSELIGQAAVLILCAAVYAMVTLYALRASQRSFESIDL